MSTWWIRLLGYTRREWRGVTGVLLLMLAGVLVGLLTPWPLKLIVDNVLAGDALPESLTWMYRLPGATTPQGLLIWLAASTVALFLAKRLLTIAQKYFQTGTGNRMVYDLGADLFDALQRRSQRFHGRNRKGDLIRRVLADTTCVRELTLDVLLPLIVALSSLAAMFAVMWRLSRPLALLAISVALPLALVVRAFARPMTDRKLEKKMLQGEMISLAEQTLTSIPLVQSFSQEARQDDRFLESSSRVVGASLRTTRAKLAFKVACGFVTALAAAAVMFIGGLQVLQGSLTIGALLVLLHYFAALYAPMESIAYLADSVASSAAGAKRVFEVLDSDRDSIVDPPHAPSLATSLGATTGARLDGLDIRFDAVRFGYDPDRLVLGHLDLNISAGETVALVGPTGAGKSTLLSLIPRFFDPTSGTVRVGGVDTRTVALASLRKSIGMVLQEPFLLPLSVADNIAYARPDASLDDIRQAARAAGASEFVDRLPHGLDTVLGERGATLSGGEKQRLAIARALLKDAPVLLLDEPTAALDAFTEASVLEALADLMRGRTTIIVSHRLSTLRNADRIVVLDRGRIVEEGTRADLEARGGLYYRLLRLQTDIA